ncbi:MAG: hypothetical protein KC613_23495 [Myxococcales bacterium]|nr:hypothetical protein [Myxococcales bacterium]MCB9522437.1 hypothetical protein [Myxococcales bacterium]
MLTRRALLLLAPLGLWPAVALGYLLPPTARLRFAAKRLQAGRGRRLRFTGRVWLQGRPLGVDCEWRFDGKVARFAARAADGRTATATGADPAEGEPALLPPPRVRALLDDLFRAADPRRAAQRIGLASGAHKLSLHGEQVVHVLGRGAELWFDQDSHALRRVLAPDPEGDLDLELLGWADEAGEAQGAPTEVRLRVGGRWRLALERAR